MHKRPITATSPVATYTKHVADHSERRIAAAIGISRYTVAEYLRRATVVGITWPGQPNWTMRR